MEFHNFEELLCSRPRGQAVRLAVVGATEKDTLAAVDKAARQGFISPILIGPADVIHRNLDMMGISFQHEIIHSQTSQEWLKETQRLLQRGEAQLVMKDQIQTGELMRLFVKKENGFLRNKMLSHLAFNELPYYHKLVCVTDTSLNLHPSLEDKKALIDNAVSVMLRMGFDEPKVAVLAAVEYANPKMEAAVEAAELKAYYMGQPKASCIVEGPISLDLALDKTAAQVKKYQSPVAGDADLLVVPDLVSGNLMGKAFNYTPDSKFAGFVVGACVPIILTSRASSVQNKYLSIALATLGA